MFGLSASHLLILGVIALLFGSRRLPELGASMGKALRAFKAATDGSLPIEPQRVLSVTQEVKTVAVDESGSKIT